MAIEIKPNIEAQGRNDAKIVELAKKPLDGSRLASGKEIDWTAADAMTLDSALKDLKGFIVDFEQKITDKLLLEQAKKGKKGDEAKKGVDNEWPLLDPDSKKITAARYIAVLDSLPAKVETLDNQLLIEQTTMQLKHLAYAITHEQMDDDTKISLFNSLYSPLSLCGGGMAGQVDNELEKLTAKDLSDMVITFARSIPINLAGKHNLKINNRNIMLLYSTRYLPNVSFEWRDPHTIQPFDEDKYVPKIVEAIENEYTLSKFLENIVATVTSSLAGRNFSPIGEFKLSDDDKKIVKTLEFLDIKDHEVEKLLQSKIENSEMFSLLDAVVNMDIDDYMLIANDTSGIIKNGKLYPKDPQNNCLYIKKGADKKLYVHATCNLENATREFSLNIDENLLDTEKTTLLEMFDKVADQRKVSGNLDATKVIDRDFIEYKTLQGLQRLHLLQLKGTEKEFDKPLSVDVDENIKAVIYPLNLNGDAKIYLTDHAGNFITEFTEDERFSVESLAANDLSLGKKQITFNDIAKVIKENHVLSDSQIHSIGMNYPDYIHAHKNDAEFIKYFKEPNSVTSSGLKKYALVFPDEIWKSPEVIEVIKDKVTSKEIDKLIKIDTSTDKKDIERRVEAVLKTSASQFAKAMLKMPTYSDYLLKERADLLAQFFAHIEDDHALDHFRKNLAEYSKLMWRDKSLTIAVLAKIGNSATKHEIQQLINIDKTIKDNEIAERISMVLRASSGQVTAAMLENVTYLKFLLVYNRITFTLMFNSINQLENAQNIFRKCIFCPKELWRDNTLVGPMLSKIKDVVTKDEIQKLLKIDEAPGNHQQSKEEEIKRIETESKRKNAEIKRRVDAVLEAKADRITEEMLKNPVYSKYLLNNINLFMNVIASINNTTLALDIFRKYMRERPKDFWLHDAVRQTSLRLIKYMTEEEKRKLMFIPPNIEQAELDKRLAFIKQISTGFYQQDFALIIQDDPRYLSYLISLRKSKDLLPVVTLKQTEKYLDEFGGDFWNNPNDIWNFLEPKLHNLLFKNYPHEPDSLINALFKLPPNHTQADLELRFAFLNKHINKLPLGSCLRWLLADQARAQLAFKALQLQKLIKQYQNFNNRTRRIFAKTACIADSIGKTMIATAFALPRAAVLLALFGTFIGVVVWGFALSTVVFPVVGAAFGIALLISLACILVGPLLCRPATKSDVLEFTREPTEFQQFPYIDINKAKIPPTQYFLPVIKRNLTITDRATLRDMKTKFNAAQAAYENSLKEQTATANENKTVMQHNDQTAQPQPNSIQHEEKNAITNNKEQAKTDTTKTAETSQALTIQYGKNKQQSVKPADEDDGSGTGIPPRQREKNLNQPLTPNFNKSQVQKTEKTPINNTANQTQPDKRKKDTK